MQIINTPRNPKPHKATHTETYLKMSAAKVSVDVLLYPGVLPPSPFTSAISNISLSLVTKLIEDDIYIIK
jgi:hypothetical protein